MTCHNPVYVLRLQKEGQIPVKLNFTRNGSETVKCVEAINLSLQAIAMLNYAKFKSQWDLPSALEF